MKNHGGLECLIYAGKKSRAYLGQLRKLIGHKKIIHPSIRAIIQDEKERILFIERRGQNRWGMPAGSMELGESIACKIILVTFGFKSLRPSCCIGGFFFLCYRSRIVE